MDTYAKAAVATQEIILDAVDELNIPIDEFMDKMELDEIDTMLSEPCLSVIRQPVKSAMIHGRMLTSMKAMMTLKSRMRLIQKRRESVHRVISL